MDTLFSRDKSHKTVQEELEKKYKIAGFTRQEYDDLCLRCRKFNVRQIMHREDRGAIDGSRWIFCVQVRDQDIFVAYYTPDDLVTEVLLLEHFRKAEDPIENVPQEITRKRKIKETIGDKPDLLEDMKEAGIA